jgi:hypothetical protein
MVVDEVPFEPLCVLALSASLSFSFSFSFCAVGEEALLAVLAAVDAAVLFPPLTPFGPDLVDLFLSAPDE